jgi:hypothetical protein
MEIKMVQIAGPVNIASEVGSYAGVRAKETTVAIVRRPMRVAGKIVSVGTVLDPAFVSLLPRDNRRVLIEQGIIELMPVSLELTKG